MTVANVPLNRILVSTNNYQNPCKESTVKVYMKGLDELIRLWVDNKIWWGKVKMEIDLVTGWLADRAIS